MTPSDTTAHAKPPADGCDRPGSGASSATTTRARSPASLLRLLALGAVLTLLLVTPATTMPPGLAAGVETGPVALLTACVLYALLLALPFVPAMEIGLLIMTVFGKWGAVGAWLATVAGLNLAYGIARAWPRSAALDRERLPRPLQRLGRRLPFHFLPAAALALLLNLPGNSALGGGGGIALLYGASRALSWPRFALTVALATAVLPALFFLAMP